MGANRIARRAQDRHKGKANRMHYVIYPKTIELVNLRVRPPVPLLDAKGNTVTKSLFDITCDVAFTDKRQFGAGWKAGVALAAIYEKLATAKVGDVLAVEDDHYERWVSSLLCLTAETDQDAGVRYDPLVLAQVIPLLRSVKDAMDDEKYKEYLAKQSSPEAGNP